MTRDMQKYEKEENRVTVNRHDCSIVQCSAVQFQNLRVL